MNLEKVLIKEVAKKKGMSEDEVKALLEEDENDPVIQEVKQSLGLIADVGESLKGLPPQIQSFAAPLMFSAFGMPRSRETDVARTFEKIVTLKEALKMLRDDDSGGKKDYDIYKELIEKMNEEMKELREKLEEKEKKELLDYLKATQDYIERLEAKIEELESRRYEPVEREEKKKTIVDELTEAAKRIEETRKTLEQLGFKFADRREPTFEEIKKYLEEKGYEIKPKYVDPEKLKEVEEKAKEEGYRKGLEDAQTFATVATNLTALGNSIIQHIFSPIVQKKVAEDRLKLGEMLKMRKTSPAQQPAPQPAEKPVKEVKKEVKKSVPLFRVRTYSGADKGED